MALQKYTDQYPLWTKTQNFWTKYKQTESRLYIMATWEFISEMQG